MKKVFFKFTLISVLLVLLVPTIVSAAWWNPFTWNWKAFLASSQKAELAIPASSREGISDMLTEPHKETSFAVNTISEESKKVLVKPAPVSKPIVPQKVNVKTVQKETVSKIEVPKEDPIKIEQKISLEIIDIVVSDITPRSAKVSWRTNFPSESKILIDGRSIFSVKGVGIEHEAIVGNLEEEKAYSGNITAIFNGAWVSSDINLKTQAQPIIKQPENFSPCGQGSYPIVRTDRRTGKKEIIGCQAIA